MGTRYDLVCPACDYKATVSGGDDAGWSLVTTTILCETCAKLFDAVLLDIDRGEREEREPQCPRQRKKPHVIHPWTRPGPCPRCGETMQDGGIVCLWD